VADQDVCVREIGEVFFIEEADLAGPSHWSLSHGHFALPFCQSL
jgi:hypothetical protein